MPLTFWAGQAQPSTTHEALARKRLIERFQSRFADAKYPVFVVFDFYCGADLDMAVFTPDALVVVELKECAAAIQGAENGTWPIAGDASPAGELKGGRYGNPFQQVKHYRYTLMDFLGRTKNGFLSSQKASLIQFDHITAVLAVSPSLHPGSKLDIRSHPWFHIVGLDELAELVENLHSSLFSFSAEELRRLVSDVMHCNQIVPPPAGGAPQQADAAEWEEISGPAGQAQWHTQAATIAEHSRDEILALEAQGTAEGLLAAGVAYQAGARGIPKDDGKAVSCLRKAAELGHPAAQREIGLRYLFGDGLARDDLAAALWLEKAASHGNARALAMLGVLYENGRGVEQSVAKAAHFYRQASELGDAIAQNQLANLYANGSPGVVAKDTRKALELYQKAAEQGHSAAESALGAIYALGLDVAQNFELGRFWLEKAVAQGDVTAQLLLAHMHEQGSGVERNGLRALDLYSKAAAQGDATAQAKVAELKRGLQTRQYAKIETDSRAR